MQRSPQTNSKVWKETLFKVRKKKVAPKFNELSLKERTQLVNTCIKRINNTLSKKSRKVYHSEIVRLVWTNYKEENRRTKIKEIKSLITEFKLIEKESKRQMKLFEE